MTSPFRHDHYTAERPRVLSLCRQQYIDMLRRFYPDDPIKKIEDFVDDEIKTHLKIPNVELIRHPSPGNTVREVVPLSVHLSRDVRDRIISPSGSVYYKPTERESFLRITIAGKKAERSKFKKIMLKCKEDGDNLQAAVNNYLQSNAKVTNNSFAGALNSPFNILYDKANFAATTSISRQSVKCGYSHLELLLGGNLYFTNYDDVVNYCLRQIKASDRTRVKQVVQGHSLYVPTHGDVLDYLVLSISNYVLQPPIEELRKFVATLTPLDRCIVFYNGCLKNVVFFNETLFRPYFDQMFDISAVKPLIVDDPKILFKKDADLLMMVRSLHADALGLDKEGRPLNFDKAIESNLAGVYLFLGIYAHYEQMIALMQDVFSVFLKVDSDLPKLHDCPNMVRTNTLISDTDSAIFTTQNFVEWYAKRLSFDHHAFAMNAFTVFVVVKTLEHRFARLSCGFGMVGNDIYGINMKNEFFMAVLIRTNIKKHYASLNVYQEGKLLPEPKVDIKGVQLRDSKLSAATNEKIEAFIKQLFDDVQKKGTIKGFDYLNTVRQFELDIAKSLLSGERLYLKTDPIKRPEEYKNDALSTSYFYYDLWENVFVPDFDPIIIPNKCFVLPLKNDGKILLDPTWRAQVMSSHPQLLKRLDQYLERDEIKRTPTRIMLPPSISEIPEILRPLIDIRSIIFTNCQPFYLVLKSIGFAYNFAPDKFLIADFFEADKDISIPYN